MDKKSSESLNAVNPRSAANQPFQGSANLRANWPPPLQLKKDKDGKEVNNELSQTQEYDAPPPFNPESKKILNSGITIQKKSNEFFKQIGAKAYTQGQSIFLPDSFNSRKSSDQKTFLHEVSHAITNESSTPQETTSKNGFGINDDTDLEHNADLHAEKLHQTLNQGHIDQIIAKKSTRGQSAAGPIQREETEDEKLINASRTKIDKVNKDQAAFNEAMESVIIKPGFSSDYHDPDRPYDTRRNLEYSTLVPLLKKDILHLVKMNTRESERIAKISIIRHLSGSQENLASTGYKASQEIEERKRALEGRNGHMSSYAPAEHVLAYHEKTEEHKNTLSTEQGILNEVKDSDPLIFIASNLGRTDLLENLQSGHKPAEKRQAISEIMKLFNTYTIKTIDYAAKSPFEFQPVIQELIKGRIGPTGYNWSEDPGLVNEIVSQGNFEKLIDSLGFDIAAVILAIGSAFATGGLSTLLLAGSMVAEIPGVINAAQEMDDADAASKSNASTSLSVLDKAIADGKKVEFFLTAGFAFLGVAVDGVELTSKIRSKLKYEYHFYTDGAENLKVTKISTADYHKKFDGPEGEKAYRERRNAHNKKKDAAKKEGKSDADVNAMKMSDADEKLTAELTEILRNDNAEFAKRMPASIRNAGGWKALLKEVGDDTYIRAGMEQWRSNIFSKVDEMAAAKFDIPLIRTGSQADSQAGILELMKGSKSDMDITILGNKVHQVREMIREQLCKEFNCKPDKLGDYLDMSVFANTPIKAILDTIADPVVRKAMVEDQSRFEMAAMYNLLYDKAVKSGKGETAKVLEKQMASLKIPKEKMALYETMAQKDELQKVIDNAMGKAEKIEEAIKKNTTEMQSLKGNDAGNQNALKNLESEKQQLEKQLHDNYKQAMIGTTLMDISDSESFWSHAGLMEIVFKQNPDFKYLSKASGEYTQAQKQVMVVHDMAQLESKLMKIDGLDAEFSQIKNIDSGLLKDTSKSASRLANALSINATDKLTKENLSKLSARLLENKEALSGPVSKELVEQFKKELQRDLRQIDALCKRQISNMADSSMVSKFGDNKMIGKYQAQMTKKILYQQTSDMIRRLLSTMGKKSGAINRINNNVEKTQSPDLLKAPEVKENISSSTKAISSGNSKDTIKSLLKIGQILKDSGQEIGDMKFDHLIKNVTENFTFLKKRSATQGGLFSNSDIKRTEFVKARFNKLSFYIHGSGLSSTEKKELGKTIAQLKSNLDNLITPKIKSTTHSPRKGKKKDPKKKIVKPNFTVEKEYFTAKDREQLEEKRRKPILQKNTGSYSLSIRVGKGKFVSILPGEAYYVDKNGIFLGKKDD